MTQNRVHYEPLTPIRADMPYAELWGVSASDESNEKLEAKRNFLLAFHDNIPSGDWHIEAIGFINGAAVMVVAPWHQVFEMAWSIHDATSCAFTLLMVRHDAAVEPVQLSTIGFVDFDDIARRLVALEQEQHND